MDGGYSLLIVHHMLHIPWAAVHCTLNGNDACIEVWAWGLPHCYTEGPFFEMHVVIPLLTALKVTLLHPSTQQLLLLLEFLPFFHLGT